MLSIRLFVAKYKTIADTACDTRVVRICASDSSSAMKRAGNKRARHNTRRVIGCIILLEKGEVKPKLRYENMRCIKDRAP